MLASAAGSGRCRSRSSSPGTGRPRSGPGEIIREVVIPRVGVPAPVWSAGRTSSRSPSAGSSTSASWPRRFASTSTGAGSSGGRGSPTGAWRRRRAGPAGPRRRSRAGSSPRPRPVSRDPRRGIQADRRRPRRGRPTAGGWSSASGRSSSRASAAWPRTAGWTFAPGDPGPPDDPSRALRHESGAGHVTGPGAYADDIAQRRPMLDVWPVVCAARARADSPEGRREARRAPGSPPSSWPRTFRARTTPGTPGTTSRSSRRTRCFYHGQIVALVVGESLSRLPRGGGAGRGRIRAP